MSLTPLKQWICDSCGEIIKKPEDGWFEWYLEGINGHRKGLRIVHNNKSCMYDDSILKEQNRTPADSNLTDFLGSVGFGHLLYWLELSETRNIYKIADIKEFIEIIRRLYLPYWEEARLYWDTSLQDGFHDGCSFDEGTLKSIIKEYGEIG